MTGDIRHVAVVGAGGMGALFGAILAEGGLAVTLVDTDHDHIESIRRDGLRISGLGGDRHQKIAAMHDATQVAKADIVLVQCKGTATREAALSMRHLADQGAVFISFQNGLGNEDILAEILGADNVLGGLTSMAGARLGPGHIRDFDRVPSYIGDWGGDWGGEWQGGKSPRAEAIAAAFTAAGLETHASADIRADIWKKLLGNMTMSAVSGVTNLTSTEILQMDSLRQVCFTALDEAISIAHSQDINLDREAVVRGLELMTAPGGTGDNKSSLCLDVLARRPSEVEFIYGKPLQLADAAGLAVPTLRSLYGLVKGIETQYVSAAEQNGTS
jgi:2-dehydropantoate 2-reductase